MFDFRPKPRGKNHKHYLSVHALNSCHLLFVCALGSRAERLLFPHVQFWEHVALPKMKHRLWHRNHPNFLSLSEILFLGRLSEQFRNASVRK